MSETLEDVMNDEVTTEEPAEQQAEETIQATADVSEEVTESTGDTVEETQAASPPEADNDPVKGLQAGIADERRKRQEAEARLQQLENHFRSQQQTPEQETTFWDDPDRALNGYAQQLQANTRKMMTDMSEELMRTTHDDYDETIGKFREMVGENPVLIQQMHQSANPAKFAYDAAKQRIQQEQYSDPKFMEKMKAQWLEEYKAEQAGKVEEKIQQSLPGTLSTERAAGGNSNRNKSHESLNEIIGR